MNDTITKADLDETSEDMSKIDHQHQITHIINTSLDLVKIKADKADESTGGILGILSSMIP